MTSQAEVIAGAYEAIISHYKQRLDLADAQLESVVHAAVAVGDGRTLIAIGRALHAMRPLKQQLGSVVSGEGGADSNRASMPTTVH